MSVNVAIHDVSSAVVSYREFVMGGDSAKFGVVTDDFRVVYVRVYDAEGRELLCLSLFTAPGGLAELANMGIRENPE